MQLDFLCNMNHDNALRHNILMTIVALISSIYHCITTLTVYVATCIFTLFLDNSKTKYVSILSCIHKPILSEQRLLWFQIWAGGIPSNATGTNLDAGRSTWGTGDIIMTHLLRSYGSVSTVARYT